MVTTLMKMKVIFPNKKCRKMEGNGMNQGKNCVRIVMLSIVAGWSLQLRPFVAYINNIMSVYCIVFSSRRLT